MQYVIYENNGNRQAYPYLVDVQSDIIDQLNTRMVIPLYPVSKMATAPVSRLTPILKVAGTDYLVMTHEMASVRLSQLGEKVMDASPHRQAIKNALDFIFDGF